LTFWPAGFDPRDPESRILQLVDIDAPSGLARFLVGQDGVFRDHVGNEWWGAQLVDASAVEISRATRAPEGSLTLTWFQDPEAGDLIEDLVASGDSDLEGARVRFFLQPLRSLEDLYAPTLAPVLFATRYAGGVAFGAPDDVTRTIRLTIESVWARRRSSPGTFYTPPDYQRFLGNPSPRNPSLDEMPVSDRPNNSLVV
jgi:hypothetical protein